MNDIRIPYGLCDITYGDKQLKFFADKASFRAIPKYEKVNGGFLNEITQYYLVDYEVSLSVVLESEDYETLMMHYPSLVSDGIGLFDNPSNVNTDGQLLTIHSRGETSRDYDINILNAYISPENGFKRVFGKEKDKFEIIFIGKPSQHFQLKNSFFYIGDLAQKVGDLNVNWLD